MRVTASNIVKAIMSLSRDVWFDYVNLSTKTKVKVVRSDGPEGSIHIHKKTSNGKIIETSLSTAMIWRIANAFQENLPINFDRILAGSYNNRSALEALLAHTPEFYWCNPGRIELTNNSSEIKRGHKHLVWLPSKPHENGILAESKISSEMAISELPTQSVTYEALSLPDVHMNHELGIEVARRHLQIQIALLEIGYMIGYRTWIAHNDKGFTYGTKKIGELEGVIHKLQSERVLSAYDEAINAANLIDCIWFKNGKFMPAVMEVEHSTGVTSGLNRMKKFKELGPALEGIRWVIVASDEDRDDVIKKANEPQFKSLDTKFFPYSAVEELHSICKRRKVTNGAINESFLDCFMEKCVN